MEDRVGWTNGYGGQGRVDQWEWMTGLDDRVGWTNGNGGQVGWTNGNG